MFFGSIIVLNCFILMHFQCIITVIIMVDVADCVFSPSLASDPYLIGPLNNNVVGLGNLSSNDIDLIYKRASFMS